MLCGGDAKTEDCHCRQEIAHFVFKWLNNSPASTKTLMIDGFSRLLIAVEWRSPLDLPLGCIHFRGKG